ncbi:MAG: hypothetical protein Q8R05_08825 [Candidatus Omnitrophota bacterium]|nr:hypothetical protein [Candidatus Omnitrophota bacterium]
MTRKKIFILIAIGSLGGILGAIVDATKNLIPGIIWKNPNKGSIYAFVLIGVVAASVLAYIWLNDTDKTDKK